MRQMTIAGALCIAAVLSVADRAEGDMVGVSWSATNSPVVRLDESTGAGATIGLSGFTGLNALAVDGSGTLYSAVDNINAITKPLITINPSTGAGTAVAPLNFGAIEPFVRGLAFSPAGVLYAVNNTGPPGQTVSHDLYTIDPNTGIGTHVGITGLGVQGIDFSPGGILYGWDVFDGLVTIDTATGAATDVNPLVGGSALLIQTIVFAPNGTLFGARDALFTIDVATGAATLVGSGGYSDLRGIEFIAPVPEPNSFVLLALGLAGLRLAMSKKNRRERYVRSGG